MSTDKCKCSTDADCGDCAQPFCVNGTCRACQPTNMLDANSECYHLQQVCSSVGLCANCTSNAQCQQNYGANYLCNPAGECYLPVSPSPSPSPPAPIPLQTPLSLLIAIAVSMGIFLIVLIIFIVAAVI